MTDFCEKIKQQLKNQSFGKLSHQKSMIKSCVHKVINGDKLRQYVGQRVDQY